MLEFDKKNIQIFPSIIIKAAILSFFNFSTTLMPKNHKNKHLKAARNFRVKTEINEGKKLLIHVCQEFENI